jgi:dynein intermediate chain
VKLWNPKQRKTPLLSFESAEDYIYDVCWNRSNPHLFASVDGEGFVDLWDLSKDLEIPLLHHKSGNSSKDFDPFLSR